MSTLVLVLLGLPVVAATAAYVVPDRAVRAGVVVAAAIAAGWAVVASSSDPVTAGELTVDPLLAAGACGLAVLVAGARARTPGGVVAGLLVLTVGPLGAALEVPPLPDRRLAAGLVLVAVLAAVRLWREQAPRLGQAVTLLAGVVLATGVVGDSPGEAVVLTAAGSTVAVLATAVWVRPGRLLLPVGMLAVARVAPDRATPDGVDWVLVLVAVLLVVGAVALVLVRSRPVAHRLPLAAVLAAVGMLATDLVEVRGAGALLGAGAVLAIAGRHPVALVALVPGLAAAFDVAGTADQPEHALLGAVVVTVLLLGALPDGRGGAVRVDRRPDLLAVLAAAFAVVPVWGWADVDLDAYRSAVAVAGAVAVLALLVQALLAVRGDVDLPARRRRRADVEDLATWVEPGPPTAEPTPAAVAPAEGSAGFRGRVGRIVGRPLGSPSHGTALQEADSVPEEGHGEAGDRSSS